MGILSGEATLQLTFLPPISIGVNPQLLTGLLCLWKQIKLQKLFPLVKTAEKHRSVSINLKIVTFNLVIPALVDSTPCSSATLVEPKY